MEISHAQDDRLLYRILFPAIVTGTGQKSKIPTDFSELIVENALIPNKELSATTLITLAEIGYEEGNLLGSLLLNAQSASKQWFLWNRGGFHCLVVDDEDYPAVDYSMKETGVMAADQQNC